MPRPRVLVLSPYPLRIAQHIGEAFAHTAEPVGAGELRQYEIAISYGYRHIIPAVQLAIPVANLHLSLLPFNRGADPNLWSWVDDTPKGVTLHWMTGKVDAGPLIANRRLEMHPGGHTLRSSYNRLQTQAENLFRQFWPLIRAGAVPEPPISPVNWMWHPSTAGSYHRKADAALIWDMLGPMALDLPLETVQRLVAEMRAEMRAEAELGGRYHDKMMGEADG